jgi:hypothetical protein
MSDDLEDYHQRVAYWRAFGLTEAEAHAKAEAQMESQLSGEKVRDE